jgi:hypothetical protein
MARSIWIYTKDWVHGNEILPSINLFILQAQGCAFDSSNVERLAGTIFSQCPETITPVRIVVTPPSRRMLARTVCRRTYCVATVLRVSTWHGTSAGVVVRVNIVADATRKAHQIGVNGVSRVNLETLKNLISSQSSMVQLSPF